MIYRFLFFLFFLVTCFIPGGLCGNNLEIKSVDLLSSTEKGLTIKIQPHILDIDTIVIDQLNYLKINMLDAGYDGNPGEPLLPFFSIPVGIPVGADITYDILESDFTEIPGKLVPHPEIIINNGLSTYRYVINKDIYSSGNPYPGNIIDVNEPGFFRDQQLVMMKLYPVRFQPSGNEIQVFKSVTLRINFSNTIAPNRNVKNVNISESKLYDDLVINSELAKHWRKDRRKSLKKSSTINAGQDWLRIKIKSDGIYKITGDMLSKAGIDIKTIDPDKIKIFNDGGQELSRNLNETYKDQMTENAIIVEHGGDNILDILDYVLFYGKSVNNWKYIETIDLYEHYVNHYEEYNYYWMTWDGSDSGKRMQSVTVAENNSIQPESYFICPYYFEQNINNFLNSGYEWYGRFYGSGDNNSYTVNLPNALSDSSYFDFNFLGWIGPHTFNVSLNNQYLQSTTSYITGNFHIRSTKSGFLQNGYNSVKFEYTSSNTSQAKAYLDWFEIHYRRQFIADDNYLEFFTSSSSTPRKYKISDFTTNNIKIFDVTDFSNVKLLSNPVINNQEISFVDTSNYNSSRRLIALATSTYSEPEEIQVLQRSDIRNPANEADFIIITHDDFFEAASKLAEHRMAQDNLKSVAVKISDIYNEFSCGLLDPTAIRIFLKYAFENWKVQPEYVLLFGDGDYDVKNIINKEDKNWIPTHQTIELDETDNRSIEDWFVYVSGIDEIPDMSIGRIPVHSASEAQIVVDKIINYEKADFLSDESFGLDDWRNIVVMVGDDELKEGGVGNEIIHTNDAEKIIEGGLYLPENFNKKKIYLSEYPEERGTSYLSTILKPKAAQAIMDHINQGALIINYVGHGNPRTWSHEYVLYAPRDFNKIQNGNKLAFWVAATCDFGRFDDPSLQGLAEDILITEGLGAIALLASTRKVYAADNAALNRTYYRKLFSNGETNERIGMALLKSKIERGSSKNDQKYLLLGDPTLKLAIPQYHAQITTITPDTIKALSKINVSGHILKENAIWNEFTGKALLKVFDSKKQRNYVTAQGSTLRYKLPGNTIFRGIGNINNGHFEISFIVPKDITYGGNLGRVSIYFANNDINGTAYQNNLLVGGTAEIFDNEGPEISIGLKNEDFFNQGFTDEFPEMKIEISDSISGINIAGEIGHNITMIIDDDDVNKILLTDLFQYNEGSYTKGKIIYNFTNYTSLNSNETGSQTSGLDEGLHKIKIKAWDNSNNSSTTQTEFIVIPGSELKLNNVLNYPNPFRSNTIFSFWVNNDCQVSIKIYTVAGRLIYKFDEFYLSTNELAQKEWDGRDMDGDPIANGVYFYRVNAKATINGESKAVEEIQKLVKME